MKSTPVALMIFVSLFLMRSAMSTPPQDSTDLSSDEVAPDEQAAPDPAEQFAKRMESAPPDERVPNWSNIKTMMARKAPKVGVPAPDFTLKTLDGEDEIRLSQFAGKQPVVLIFGSYT